MSLVTVGWGLGLAVIFALVIKSQINKKIKREVKQINVKKPDDFQGELRSSSPTESAVEDEFRRREIEEEFGERGRVQPDFPATDDVDKSEPERDEEGSEPTDPADLLPEPEPFEE